MPLGISLVKRVQFRLRLVQLVFAQQIRHFFQRGTRTVRFFLRARSLDFGVRRFQFRQILRALVPRLAVQPAVLFVFLFQLLISGFDLFVRRRFVQIEKAVILVHVFLPSFFSQTFCFVFLQPLHFLSAAAISLFFISFVFAGNPRSNTLSVKSRLK